MICTSQNRSIAGRTSPSLRQTINDSLLDRWMDGRMEQSVLDMVVSSITNSLLSGSATAFWPLPNHRLAGKFHLRPVLSCSGRIAAIKPCRDKLTPWLCTTLPIVSASSIPTLPVGRPDGQQNDFPSYFHHRDRSRWDFKRPRSPYKV